MNATACPNNPPGHHWQAGLTCRWCHTTRTPGEAVLSGLASVRGWTPEAARTVRDAYRAEVLAADGQAYDGQLVMLTGLVATLNAVAEHGDLTEVRKLLAEHAAEDAAAREKISPAGADATSDLHGRILKAIDSTRGPALPLPAHTRRLLAAAVTEAVAPLVPYREVWDASLPPGGRVCVVCGQPVESEPCPDHAPGFFRPGRTYTDGTGYTAPEITTVFRVEHVTRHPNRGHLRAIGWSRTGEPGAGWHGDFRDEGEFDGWTDITEGEAADA